VPGLDHAVSAITRRTDADPYLCNGLPRERKLVPVQDGWTEDGRRNIVYYEDFGSVPCRYDMSLSDRRCFGCVHGGTGEQYDQMIRSKGR
jgi:hypothetical protein